MILKSRQKLWVVCCLMLLVLFLRVGSASAIDDAMAVEDALAIEAAKKSLNAQPAIKDDITEALLKKPEVKKEVPMEKTLEGKKKAQEDVSKEKGMVALYPKVKSSNLKYFKSEARYSIEFEGAVAPSFIAATDPTNYAVALRADRPYITFEPSQLKGDKVFFDNASIMQDLKVQKGMKLNEEERLARGIIFLFKGPVEYSFNQKGNSVEIFFTLSDKKSLEQESVKKQKIDDAMIWTKDRYFPTLTAQREFDSRGIRGDQQRMLQGMETKMREESYLEGAVGHFGQGIGGHRWGHLSGTMSEEAFATTNYREYDYFDDTTDTDTETSKPKPRPALGLRHSLGFVYMLPPARIRTTIGYAATYENPFFVKNIKPIDGPMRQTVYLNFAYTPKVPRFTLSWFNSLSVSRGDDYNGSNYGTDPNQIEWDINSGPSLVLNLDKNGRTTVTFNPTVGGVFHKSSRDNNDSSEFRSLDWPISIRHLFTRRLSGYASYLYSMGNTLNFFGSNDNNDQDSETKQNDNYQDISVGFTYILNSWMDVSLGATMTIDQYGMFVRPSGGFNMRHGIRPTKQDYISLSYVNTTVRDTSCWNCPDQNAGSDIVNYQSLGLSWSHTINQKTSAGASTSVSMERPLAGNRNKDENNNNQNQDWFWNNDFNVNSYIRRSLLGGRGAISLIYNFSWIQERDDWNNEYPFEHRVTLRFDWNFLG